MKVIEHSLREQLAAREQVAALRRLPPEHDRVDFSSNDYLGLTRCPSFRRRFDEAARAVRRTGSGGSRLLAGNSAAAERLEQRLAAVHRAESALLFPSGYAANTGLLAAVAGRHDTILFDQLVHASIRDGLLLSRARSYGFRHNDLDQLRDKLRHAAGNRFIVVESIYSMDGDEAPLGELATLAAEHEAALIVDEAHATGVFGPGGAGLVVGQGLEEQVWARVHTFGKAVGSHGAAVVGPAYLRDFLVNFSRPFIYTTALPEHTLLTIDLAYDEMTAGEGQLRLRENIRRFLQGLSASVSSRLLPARGPIQALLCPGNEAVRALSAAVQAAGYDVRPILHPTVAKGEERLRICLHADHTDAQIGGLANTLNRLMD